MFGLVSSGPLLARQEEQLKPAADRYDMVQQRLIDLVEQMDALKRETAPLLKLWLTCDPVPRWLGTDAVAPSEMVLERFQVEGSRLSVNGTCFSRMDCARSMPFFSNWRNPVSLIQKWFNWKG